MAKVLTSANVFGRVQFPEEPKFVKHVPRAAATEVASDQMLPSAANALSPTVAAATVARLQHIQGKNFEQDRTTKRRPEGAFLEVSEDYPSTSSNRVAVKSFRRLERLQRRVRAQEEFHRRLKTLATASGVVRDITRKRLLTPSEEAKLSIEVQELLRIEKARNELVTKIKREPTLEEWANAAGIGKRCLQMRFWTGRMSKSKVISCNIGLVAEVARKYLDSGLPLEDLVQEGRLGLIRGVEKFDPSRGYRLSTYAYWWIKQAIGRAVNMKANTVSLSVHSSRIVTKIERARSSLYRKYGRAAEDQEVASTVGISVQRMHALLNSRSRVKSLDKQVGRDVDISLHEVMPDESWDCTENVTKRMLLKEGVDVSLDHLKPQERNVIRLRYGLDGGRAKTLEEISYRYKVTRERIRQVEVRAMHKLKSSDVSKLLRLHFGAL